MDGGIPVRPMLFRHWEHCAENRSIGEDVMLKGSSAGLRVGLWGWRSKVGGS